MFCRLLLVASSCVYNVSIFSYAKARIYSRCALDGYVLNDGFTFC